MRSERLMDVLNFLDDEILEETNAVRSRKRKRTYPLQKWGALVACAVLFVMVGRIFFISQEWKELPSLPKLSVFDYSEGAGGGGGLWAFDAAEFVNNNPWNEEIKLSTLPVYKNYLEWDEVEAFQVNNPNYEAMEDMAYEIADRFGLENVKSTRHKTNIIQFVDIITEDITIHVDRSLCATVTFENPISLPQEYTFTYHSTYEDTQRVAEYLRTEYDWLMDIPDAQVNVFGGDYNIYEKQSYGISFYDGSGDITQQIINYNFNEVRFYCDEEGKLYMVRLYQPDISEKVGDYPVIDAEEAKKYLLDGDFICTSEFDIKDDGQVKKVELVYRNFEMDEYFVPYYCFYVENPEEKQGNLNTYEMCYVSAVHPYYMILGSKGHECMLACK